MRITRISVATLIMLTLGLGVSTADDGYRLWLKYDDLGDGRLARLYDETITGIMAGGASPTAAAARNELDTGLDGLLGRDVPTVTNVSRDGAVIAGTPVSSRIIAGAIPAEDFEVLGNDGYIIRTATVNGHSATVIAANTDIGMMYGIFAFLRLVQTEERLDHLNIVSIPRIERRILNHWDNLNRSVERGYAGQSLWKWDELPGTVDPRYTDYARANASIGINGTVLNNVNATPLILQPGYIEKISALADAFRPYGIRVYLSINFSSPIKPSENGRGTGGIGTLDTADPLDPAVRQWWKDKADEIYESIPDFGGFLVKANSEGQPGPQDYGRTQVDGANMLAEALEPHDGIVMWRAFVYDPEVDPDRVKRAYMEFVPHDGEFADNVIIQIKNGPLDFQPREPYSPLFGAMPKTPVMAELQITKEYLGQSVHLVYLAPMWEEFFTTDTFYRGRNSTVAQVVDGSLDDYSMTAMAGVTNIGDDTNWCGDVMLQANWFTYGRLAWDYTLTSEEIADEWIRMTLTRDEYAVRAINGMMMGSHEACVNYQEPLGLHHIMDNSHYGPDPGYTNPRTREDWTPAYYSRADEYGVGFDRSSGGSNAVSQYYEPLRSLYDDIDTYPDEFLLWFHHAPWGHVMQTGRTLWDELCVRYYAGVDYVTGMRATWASVEEYIDPEVFAHSAAKLVTHERDAGIWRDTCIEYFQTFSKMPVPEEITE